MIRRLLIAALGIAALLGLAVSSHAGTITFTITTTTNGYACTATP